MKTLCAKCKVPLKRRPETGLIFCPRCGDSLRPGAPEPHEGTDGTGKCPRCDRALEFDVARARPFCPGCDNSLRPPVPAEPPASMPAPKPAPGPRAEPPRQADPAPPAQPSPPPVTIELPEPVAEPGPLPAAEEPREEDSGDAGLTSATRTVDGCRILSFEGQVGEREYEAFKEAVRQALLAEPRRLIVDLGGMTYISSSGLSVLLWAHGAISGSGRRMILVNVHPRTLKVLKLINVDELLEIAGNAEDALALPEVSD